MRKRREGKELRERWREENKGNREGTERAEGRDEERGMERETETVSPTHLGGTS